MRATCLTVDQVRRLEHFAATLTIAVPANVAVLHVGSSLDRDDYRDVDVRVIVSDDTFRRLDGIVNVLDLNMLLSEWGRSTTELPIDCQIQSLAECEKHHGPTNAIRWMARRRGPHDAAVTAPRPNTPTVHETGDT